MAALVIAVGVDWPDDVSRCQNAVLSRKFQAAAP
jgi:hypothetical protein